MRKLPFIICFLFCSLGSLIAEKPTVINKTYSIESNALPTNFGNNFAHYHVNLDLTDLTRVARNGNLRIIVDFQKGMEVSETHFEKKPNGAIYYVTDFVSPVYEVKVFGEAENILLEKNYGGQKLQSTFGKNKNYPESILATKWLNEKDKTFQKMEFQNLNFDELEKDLIDLLDNLPATASSKKSIAEKNQKKLETAKSDRPSISEIQKEVVLKSTQTTTAKGADNEKKTSSSPLTVTPISDKKEEDSVEDINEAAAAQEEELLRDPFSELKEPIKKEQMADGTDVVPPAPRDFDDKPEEQSMEKVSKKEDKLAGNGLSITPLSDRRKNVVKLNLPNLAFGNITLNYERVLSSRTSFALNVGYILPKKSSSVFSDDSWSGEEFSGLTATGEYRIYGNKKGAPKGFYYAPYLRYAKYSLDFQGDIDENATNVASKVSTVGLGVQIGIQWLIKDRVAIDWGIIGLAAQYYTITSTFTAVDGETVDFNEIQAEFESEVSDSPISNSIDYETGDDYLKAKLPFLFGGARAYLSVGYSF